MALISNYTQVGSGVQTTWDVTTRNVFSGLYQQAGTSERILEYRFNEIIEYNGLTKQCANDLASSVSNTDRRGQSVGMPTSITRSISASVRLDRKETRSYSCIKTTETSVDLFLSGVVPPSINVSTGHWSSSWPISFNVTMAPNPLLVTGAVYVLDLYGSSLNFTGAILTTNQSVWIPCLRPSIIIVGGWNANIEACNGQVVVLS